MKFADKVFLALGAVLLLHICYSSLKPDYSPMGTVFNAGPGVAGKGVENTTSTAIPTTTAALQPSSLVSTTASTPASGPLASATTTAITSTTTTLYPADDLLVECNQTKDEYGRLWCYANAGVLLNDSSFCGLIGDSMHSAAVYCYRQLGISLRNASLCGMVSVRSDRDDCYREVGEALNKSDLCGLIRHRWDRNDCYSAIALAKNDPGLCGRITLESELQLVRDGCYLGTGTATNNSLVCAGIIHRGMRSQCYTTVARALNDSLLCSEIKDKYGYLGCMAGFS
jgi:hypothetical protein